MTINFRVSTSLVISSLLAACGNETPTPQPPPDPTPFTLRFAPVVDGKQVGCADDLQKFGPNQDIRIGMNDLRFYVSNLRFADSSGKAVALTLDTDEFQYASEDGSVVLIDLTGNTDGSCASSSVAYAEGTARTHLAITGKTLVNQVASVSFDVGLPQPLMKKVIATHTPEGSPSPMNEMYWNWNSGYRHFVFNFVVHATDGDGGGYVHVGSRDCAPGDGKALEDRETCTYVNTPSVSLGSFNLMADTVGVDLRRILKSLDFRAPIYDPTTFEVIGEGPGVECHSSPTQPACPKIFGEFGLDMETGKASASSNAAFVRVQ